MKGALDIFKHLLALAVIFHHMRSDRYADDVSSFIDSVSNLVDGAVCGFFMLSGYLFKLRPNFLKFVSVQAQRLLIPFLLFSLINAIILVGMGNLSLPEVTTRMFSLNGVGMQLYFLPYLFIVQVFSMAILQRANRYKEGIAWVLCLTSLLVVGLWQVPTSTGPGLQHVGLYTFSFFYGVTLSSLVKINLSLVWVGIFSLILGSFDSRFWDLAAVVFVFLFILKLGPLFPDRRVPGSGGVYLFHTPVLNFAISIALEMCVGVYGNPNLFISFLITWVFALATTLLVVKFIPRMKWLILE